MGIFTRFSEKLLYLTHAAMIWFQFRYYLFEYTALVCCLYFVLIFYLFAKAGVRMLQFPGIFTGCLYALIGLCSPERWFINLFNACFNLLFFVLSFWLFLRYGTGTFERVKTTGKYHVGCQDAYLPPEDGGNALTIFYPMDKNLIKGNGPRRKWLPERTAKKIIDGVFDGSTWVMSESKSARPNWFGYSLLELTINVVPNAQLAEDFASGRNKLVPIIF